jgi:hypothetical protein
VVTEAPENDINKVGIAKSNDRIHIDQSGTGGVLVAADLILYVL